jgi:hypothetical protein
MVEEIHPKLALQEKAKEFEKKVKSKLFQSYSAANIDLTLYLA